MPEPREKADVVILGGGLAGLTLALQLNDADPDLAVVILERWTFPAPEAAYKVGESTVEIGSHYLSQTLGLQERLEKTQLRKFGLRFFFGAGLQDDLSGADELGASNFLPAVSYQLDRGRLENDLVDVLRQRGVEIREGCVVKRVATDARLPAREVHWSSDEKSGVISGEWIIDASGRAGFLKRRMELARPSGHEVNAAWFRLGTELDVEDWSDSPDWLNRCNGIPRQLSTNHLLGPGYWVWIIPLVDGRVSIGLVADPRNVPLDRFKDFESLLEWAKTEQPRLAGHLQSHAGELMDYRFLRNFSYGCRQTFSNDGWGISGEAGVFPDPFYSPGTDFIAISNTLITSLVKGGRKHPMTALKAAVFDKVYQSFFASTLSLYTDQYAGFGDTRLMVLKATWDYAYYWSVLAWLYFRDRMTDIEFLRANEAQLNAARELNFKMQAAFRARAARSVQSPGRGRFFDQRAIPVLLDLNAALLSETGDDARELSENGSRLNRLAPLVIGLLNGDPSDSRDEEFELLGDLRSRFA